MARRANPASEGRRGPGQLETTVLATLWAADAPLTPAEVQARLAKAGHELAYTSVMTTLSRMHTKGLLDRGEQGRAYTYQPAAGAADAAATQMRSLLGAGSARELVLSRFVAGLGAEDEAVLHRLLTVATRPDPAPSARRARRGNTRDDPPQ